MDFLINHINDRTLENAPSDSLPKESARSFLNASKRIVVDESSWKYIRSNFIIDKGDKSIEIAFSAFPYKKGKDYWIEFEAEKSQ